MELTTSPHVDRYAVGLSLQHLRGEVARGACKAWGAEVTGQQLTGATRVLREAVLTVPGRPRVSLQLHSQPKVSQLHHRILALAGQEQVLRLGRGEGPESGTSLEGGGARERY